MSVLRESVPLKPFLNLTFFSFLPLHFPEEDPQHRAQEEGQEEAAVHQTIFQPSLGVLHPRRKKCLTRRSASQSVLQMKGEITDDD